MKSAAYNEVIKLAVAFNFLFSSFLAAKVLQTSLHEETGYFCLSVLYVVFTFAAIVAPSIVHRLGTRWSLVFGAMPYVVFVASNLYPTFAVMIVPCGLVGLGAGALWTAQGVHMGQLASLEAARTGVDVVVTSSKFNGMFYGIFQFSGAIGGVASSAILISFPESGVWVLFTVLTIIGAIALLALSRIHPAAQLVNTLQSTSHDSMHTDVYLNDGFASRGSALGGSRHASETGLELTARGSPDTAHCVHATTSINDESGYDMRELAVYEQDMAAAQPIELPERTEESSAHGSPPLRPIARGQVADFGSPVSPARSYGMINDDAADDSADDYNEFFTPEPTPRKQRGHACVASGTRPQDGVVRRGRGVGNGQAGIIGSSGLARSLLQSPPYEPDNTQWYTPETAETSNTSSGRSFVTANETQRAADVTNRGDQRTPHVSEGAQRPTPPGERPSRNHAAADSPVLADLSPMHTMYHSAAEQSSVQSGLQGCIQVESGLVDDPDVSNDITQHGRGEWHATMSPDSVMNRGPTPVVYTGARSVTVDAPRSPGARPHHRPVHATARTHTCSQNEPEDQIVDVEQALKRAAEPKTPRIRDVVMLAARDRRMLLFIPIIVYNGMSEAFLFADFFGEFVKPLLGIEYDGIQGAVFYLGSATCCVVAGRVAGSSFGRSGVAIVGVASHVLYWVLCIIVDRLVQPSETTSGSLTGSFGGDFAVLTLTSYTFSIGDAVWKGQVVAVLQTYFRRSEHKLAAAMANSKLFQSLGYALQFGIGGITAGTWSSSARALMLLVVLLIAAACMITLHTRVASMDKDPENVVEEASATASSAADCDTTCLTED